MNTRFSFLNLSFNCRIKLLTNTFISNDDELLKKESNFSKSNLYVYVGQFDFYLITICL